MLIARMTRFWEEALQKRHKYGAKKKLRDYGQMGIMLEENCLPQVLSIQNSIVDFII